jgi:toxin YhaV
MNGRRRGGRSGTQRPVPATGAIQVKGWTVFAHPAFLEQMEALVTAAEAEQGKQAAQIDGPSTKLLAHLVDLGFEKIPSDPGNNQYRHGGTLGAGLRHWFRAKTGNGRYRLFYRYSSADKIIIYGWVNDDQSLRTYGSGADAYSVFRRKLQPGYPPDDWASLKEGASSAEARIRLSRLRTTPASRTSRKGNAR